MAAFDLSKYATVGERIEDFYRDFPHGSIRTRLALRDGPEIVFEARIYRSPEDVVGGVYCSGWAHEVQDKSPVNRTSHVENAETSAVGRALANLGYSGSINGRRAPRASREEMEKVERRTAPVQTKEQRYAARIRELAIDVDGQRDRTGEYKETTAQHDAEQFLADPQCNAALMEKYGNNLGKELDRLKALPAAVAASSYDTFQAPSLSDGDELPFG